jgi:cation/acetate symporter
MFGSVGSSAFSFVTLAILAGVASSPALLQRPTATRSVLDSRTSMAWAVIIAAFTILTMTAVAVYVRAYVTEQVFAMPADRLPGWFQVLQQMDLARVDAKGSAPVSMAAIAFSRDGVLAALPVAMGLPAVFTLLALAGGLAACFAAASAQIAALAASLAEDILLGGEGHRVAPATQIWLGRGSITGVAAAGAALSLVRADPLQLVMWALTLSASALFPVLILSVMWKRLTAWGAVGGIVVGFATALTGIVMEQIGLATLTAPLPVVIALPLSLLAAIGLSFATPKASRRAHELLRDMRVPGGETLMDRQRRLEQMRADPKT